MLVPIGYLVSRRSLVHPQGETIGAAIGPRGLVQALRMIANTREKEFGPSVHQR
jgi:hypothetical protein